MQKLGQRLNMKYEACKSLKLFLFITSSIAIPWPWTHGDGGRKKLHSGNKRKEGYTKEGNSIQKGFCV